MSAAVTAVVVAAIGTGYGISSGEKSKKIAKHQKKYSRVKANELELEENNATKLAEASALSDRRKRAMGVSRNLGNISDSSGMAQQAKKILTGQ